jgi:hypothetical protein
MAQVRSGWLYRTSTFGRTWRIPDYSGRPSGAATGINSSTVIPVRILKMTDNMPSRRFPPPWTVDRMPGAWGRLDRLALILAVLAKSAAGSAKAVVEPNRN